MVYIYIYTNIGGILMVNVTIYSIHGSYIYIYFNEHPGTSWNFQELFSILSIFRTALRQVFLGTAPPAAPPAPAAPVGPEFTGPAAEEGDRAISWDGGMGWRVKSKAFWDDRNGYPLVN